MKQSNKTEWAIWGVCALSFVVTLALLPLLPARIPVHWNVDGQIDGWAARPGAFFGPAMGLGLSLLMKFLPYIDPRRRSYEKFGRAYDAFRLALALFVLILQGVTLYAAFYPDGLDVSRIIAACVGALQAAQEMNSPIILGVSEGAGKYMTGFKTVAAMVKAMIDTLGITVPVALHLDHGSYEGAKACVEAGFSSIMFDGSHYAIDENVAKTTELVALAHENGLSIEAEVGSIGGEEDGVVGMGEIADAAECARIASLGIDFLAAGIGNIHGVYPSNWKGLDFAALEKIHNATDHIPLVLHGGTGIPDDMIKKAISLGVSKINVNTECQLAFAKATREYIEAGKDQQGKGFDPRKLLAPGAEAIKNTVKEKIELFGSVGKA